jgi:hypothetical protein
LEWRGRNTIFGEEDKLDEFVNNASFEKDLNE